MGKVEARTEWHTVQGWISKSVSAWQFLLCRLACQISRQNNIRRKQSSPMCSLPLLSGTNSPKASVCTKKINNKIYIGINVKKTLQRRTISAAWGL